MHHIFIWILSPFLFCLLNLFLKGGQMRAFPQQDHRQALRHTATSPLLRATIPWNTTLLPPNLPLSPPPSTLPPPHDSNRSANHRAASHACRPHRATAWSLRRFHQPRARRRSASAKGTNGGREAARFEERSAGGQILNFSPLSGLPLRLSFTLPWELFCVSFSLRNLLPFLFSSLGPIFPLIFVFFLCFLFHSLSSEASFSSTFL